MSFWGEMPYDLREGLKTAVGEYAATQRAQRELIKATIRTLEATVRLNEAQLADLNHVDR